VADLAQLYVDLGLERDVRFYRNPFSLGTNLMTNYSNATYHSLQVDVRKQLTRNFFFQTNYTWSKVLSDSSGDSQIRFEPFHDLGNAALERGRAVFDLRHAWKANFAYSLPFVRGWVVSGDTNWQSGNPLSILSGRATFNRFSRALNNGANTTLNLAELNKLLGVRMTPSGPSYISASALGPDGRGAAADGRAPFAGQVFSHPAAGTIGGLQRRLFSGPSVFGLNAALHKTARIRDRHTVELRGEAFNVLNHPAWFLDDQNLDSPNFMRINANATGRRLLQFGIYYRF